MKCQCQSIWCNDLSTQTETKKKKKKKKKKANRLCHKNSHILCSSPNTTSDVLLPTWIGLSPLRYYWGFLSRGADCVVSLSEILRIQMSVWIWRKTSNYYYYYYYCRRGGKKKVHSETNKRLMVSVQALVIDDCCSTFCCKSQTPGCDLTAGFFFGRQRRYLLIYDCQRGGAAGYRACLTARKSAVRCRRSRTGVCSLRFSKNWLLQIQL